MPIYIPADIKKKFGDKVNIDALTKASLSYFYRIISSLT